MDQRELRQLRAFYHSLSEQKRLLDESQGYVVDGPQFEIIASEVKRLQAGFPDFQIAGFDPGRFHSGGTGRSSYFDKAAVQSYLGVLIGRLKVAIDSPEVSPVTEHRDFPFVADAKLRAIVERDYDELQRAFLTRCWKSVVILTGGAIEAILLDLLQRERRASAARAAPKGQGDLSRWDLNDLIKVAVELKLVGEGIDKLSHPVREYRNLVHPGNELRSGLTFGMEEARIAIEVLHMVHRDLSRG